MAAPAFDVAPLPFPVDALASKGMSKETVELHYGKHHKGYAVRLNAIAKDAPEKFRELKTVRDVVLRSPLGSVPYNMAAQILNHDFFWASLSPKGGVAPSAQSPLGKQIVASFGSFEKFVEAFTAQANGHFGSGWCWLVYNAVSRKLEVVTTHDAISPLSTPQVVPLLVCDVWEHAYYVDFRNDRPGFVKNFWRLANWEFAAQNFAKAVGGSKL